MLSSRRTASIAARTRAGSNGTCYKGTYSIEIGYQKELLSFSCLKSHDTFRHLGWHLALVWGALVVLQGSRQVFSHSLQWQSPRLEAHASQRQAPVAFHLVRSRRQPNAMSWSNAKQHAVHRLKAPWWHAEEDGEDTPPYLGWPSSGPATDAMLLKMRSARFDGHVDWVSWTRETRRDERSVSTPPVRRVPRNRWPGEVYANASNYPIHFDRFR